MDNNKVKEESKVENTKKSKTGIVVILGVVIIIAIVVAVVVIGGNNKTSQNNSNVENTVNEQVVTENDDNSEDSNVSNDIILNQDEEQVDETVEQDENIENEDDEETEVPVEVEIPTVTFSEIRALEENSDEFISKLTMKAFEFAQKKYENKILSLIYLNGENSKVKVNGKECYEVTITEKNEDPEKEDAILGYVAISLEEEKIYFRDVNGTY